MHTLHTFRTIKIMNIHSTPIAAIATAPGRGGIGVVRVSGNGLEPLLKILFPHSALTPRTATYLPFLDRSGPGAVF